MNDISKKPTVRVYRYEENIDNIGLGVKPVVFLAGPTVRGHQPHLTSWRFAAIDEFIKSGFDGILIVPEFTSKSESDKNKDWIPIWEYNGLKKSDCIMFWIPRTKELIGLTTNWELGYWIGRERTKLVYGRPDDAYRVRYLDIMWNADMDDRYRDGRAKTLHDFGDLEIYKTLESVVEASINKSKQQTNIRVDVLKNVISETISAHYTQAEEYINGKVEYIGLFVGEVMKKMKGNANPTLVIELIKKELSITFSI